VLINERRQLERAGKQPFCPTLSLARQMANQFLGS